LQDRFNYPTATTSFQFKQQVPVQAWYTAMSELTALKWPIHLWRNGLIIQEGLVEILVKREGLLFLFADLTLSLPKTQLCDSKAQHRGRICATREGGAK
jgi:hypothetical protein